MNLQLETNEVQFLINVLGQLQNSTGSYPLLVKISSQVQAAEPAAEEPKAA